MFQFDRFSLGLNVALFAAAAVLVWPAGTRLAHYADAIAARTHLSKVFLGIILLAVATSLPEIATTVTAALIGNAALVSGNLFGGVALQIVILAVVDVIAVRGALTYFTPQPVLLFQGVMLLLLLAIALAGAAAGDPLSFLGIGLTLALLMAGYVVTVRFSRPGDYLPKWRATNEPTSQEGHARRDTRSEHFSDSRVYVLQRAERVDYAGGRLDARAHRRRVVQADGS